MQGQCAGLGRIIHGGLRQDILGRQRRLAHEGFLHVIIFGLGGRDLGLLFLIAGFECCKINFHLAQFRFSAGLGHGKTGIIHTEQHVCGLHQLVFRYGNFFHHAGNLGAHQQHGGLHIGIVCRGIAPATEIENGGSQQHQQRNTNEEKRAGIGTQNISWLGSGGQGEGSNMALSDD